MTIGNKLELYRGSVFLGTILLAPAECDFPWLVGYLEPSEGYETVRELFEWEAKASLRAIETSSEGAIHESNEALMKILEPGIRMKNLADGEFLDVFGIGIEGSRVTWR